MSTMTKQRLDNFRHIRAAVAELTARMDDADAENAASVRAQLDAQREKMLGEYDAILCFLFQIDDLHIRRIIELRFLDGREWSEIAAILGGGTRTGVYNAFKRYIDKAQ